MKAAARQKFRTVLSGGNCVQCVSVYDPLSARIAQDLEFEAGIIGGSVASMTAMGAPDLNVLTLTELADQVRRVSRAATIPLVIDADDGFGNALNVMRTIQELEYAGASAVTIEDSLLGGATHGAGQSLISLDEGVGKIRAAIAARQDPDLVVIARTDAAAAPVGDIRDRIDAYCRAGADAICLVGVKNRQHLCALSSEVAKPIMLVTYGSPEFACLREIGRYGVRLRVEGHFPFFAALQAVHDTLKAIRQGVPAERLTGLASKQLIRRLTRAAAYDDWGKAFLLPPHGVDRKKEIRPS